MQQYIFTYLQVLQDRYGGQKRCKNNSPNNTSKKQNQKRVQNLSNRVYVSVELTLQQTRQPNKPLTSRPGHFHESQPTNDHIAEDIGVFLQRARQ